MNCHHLQCQKYSCCQYQGIDPILPPLPEYQTVYIARLESELAAVKKDCDGWEAKYLEMLDRWTKTQKELELLKKMNIEKQNAVDFHCREYAALKAKLSQAMKVVECARKLTVLCNHKPDGWDEVEKALAQMDAPAIRCTCYGPQGSGHAPTCEINVQMGGIDPKLHEITAKRLDERSKNPEEQS